MILQDLSLSIDSDKTKLFYLTQNRIIDSCQCVDCQFFSEIFIKEPLEIFSFLSSIGVDLQKNLESEPTGVWCVRDENSNFIHCDQVYQAVGHLSKSEVRYENEENGYKIKAHFVQTNNNSIEIELRIDKV
jgi:hypothetical protein